MFESHNIPLCSQMNLLWVEKNVFEFACNKTQHFLQKLLFLILVIQVLSCTIKSLSIFICLIFSDGKSFLLTTMTKVHNTISLMNSSAIVGLPLIRITLGNDNSWTAEMDTNVCKPGIKRCGTIVVEYLKLEIVVSFGSSRMSTKNLRPLLATPHFPALPCTALLFSTLPYATLDGTKLN